MSTTKSGSNVQEEGPRRSCRLNNNHNNEQLTKQPMKPSAALLAAKRKAKQHYLSKKSNEVVRDIYENARDGKQMVRKPTGLVYDLRMVDHRCLWDQNYPECPERLSRIVERCEELGLLKQCQLIQPREATESEVLMKHSPEQIAILKATENVTDEEHLEKVSSKYDAIYIHPSTYRLSLLAAGSAIDLVDNICRNNVQNGMAIIRPPGHHAMKSEYCGYCFFNNVALAAQHALINLGLSRILIVDWDVHHGQATQQMFYDDPRVVYFSLHRYEHGTFWPNLRESDFDNVGKGNGLGYNFNVPLNTTGMGDADYLAVFHNVLLPMACEFQPELVIVSAGYDAAIGCPEGEMVVTPACYAHFIRSLSGIANGKLAVVLEGGYCLRSLAESAALTLRALLDHPTPQLPKLGPPCNSMRNTILDVIYSHRPYWKCFQMQETWNADQNNIEKLARNRITYMPKVEFLGPLGPPPTTYETRNCYPVQSSTFLMSVASQINNLVASSKLLCPPNKVSFVYDVRMLNHCNASESSHPERPERISGIFSTHQEFDLLERCYILPPRVATKEELTLVHSSSYVLEAESRASLSQKELSNIQEKLQSVYLHPSSYESATVAAGCVLQVVDAVLDGKSCSGVAVVRPPGHHAKSESACGFCIFNNVSVAAKYAIERKGLSRVLIVDWDVHHGNGTQEMFESDPRVLYVSLHRYDNGHFFPGSKNAGHDRCGFGSGQGFNVNIPWNKKGMGDSDYIAAFLSIVLPIAYQFNPQLVLVSAGFDAGVGDPLGGCKVTPECYGLLTHWLQALAGGRVILCLEGGYNLSTIAYSMTMCTKALLGDPLPPTEAGVTACPSAIQSIRDVIDMQTRFWSSLCFNLALPEENYLSKDEVELDLADQLSDMKLCDEKAAYELIGKDSIHLTLCPAKAGLGDASQHVRKVAPNKPNEGSCSGSSRGDDESSSSSSRRVSEGTSSGRQTLVDYLSDNMQLLVEERMFAVVPLPTCPHLPVIEPVPESGIDTNASCHDCNSTQENWICLTCYKVFCGRYVNAHMARHGRETEHPLTLSFSDLSVWCYQCEAYIDNSALYPARNSAHRNKFGEDLPWSYGDQM